MQFETFLTSNKAVIQHNKDDEDAVKDGQSYEEPVEGVGHLLDGQDQDGAGISNQAEKPERRL